MVVDDTPLKELALYATARDVDTWMRTLMGVTVRDEGTLCPAVTVAGDTTTIDGGGCINEDGGRYVGSAVIEGSLDGEFRLTWNGYGFVAVEECDGRTWPMQLRMNGTLDVFIEASGDRAYYVDVRATHVAAGDRCLGTSTDVYWSYAFVVTDEADGDGDGWPDERRLTGSGVVSVSIDGVDAEALVATRDQVESRGSCVDEPLEGVTSFESEIGFAVLVNDGVVDCEDPPTGQWLFADEAASEIPIMGPACSVRGAAGAGTPGTLAVAALAVGLAAALRRRRGA